MRARTKVWTRRVGAGAAVALTTGLLVALPETTVSALQSTLPAVTSPTWQTNGAVRTTKIEFVKLAKTGEREGLITLLLNGVEMPVHVVGEKYENKHFQAPSYETQINGKTVAFKFTGHACFAYSVNLSMMIFGAYAHLAK